MKKNIKIKIFIILLFLIVVTILLLYLYSNIISPLLIKYSKIESKSIAIDIVSKGVSDDIIKVLNNNDLFNINKDVNNKIELIDYNPKTVNKILSITSKRVTRNFKDIEKKNNYVVMKIPMGVITKNIFLENLGPKVPVKLVLDGNAVTSLNTKVKEYGMNSALIEVSVKIEANLDVMVPFRTSKIKVVNDVPISIKVIKGNISSILDSKID